MVILNVFNKVKSLLKKEAKKEREQAKTVLRYPPITQGIPAISIENVLAGQEELLKKIFQIVETEEEWKEYYKPAIKNYAKMVHLLPASEAHHHKGVGGLFRHGLEVGFRVLKVTEQKLYGLNLVPEIRLKAKKRYLFASFVAGLCHDIGKSVTDMEIMGKTSEGEEDLWNPFSYTLYDWMTEKKIQKYFVTWKRNREPDSHEMISHLLLDQVLPTKHRFYIQEFDRSLLLKVIRAMQRDMYNEELAEIVLKADQKSTAEDLKRSNLSSDVGTNVSVPAFRFYIDTMRRLFSINRWRINEVGSRVWVIDNKLFLVWPAAGEDIKDILIQENINWLPKDPKTISDILFENDFFKQPEDGKRFWIIVPDILQNKDKNDVVALYALQVAQSAILLDVLPPSVKGLVFPDMEDEELRKAYQAVVEQKQDAKEKKESSMAVEESKFSLSRSSTKETEDKDNDNQNDDNKEIQIKITENENKKYPEQLKEERSEEKLKDKSENKEGRVEGVNKENKINESNQEKRANQEEVKDKKDKEENEKDDKDLEKRFKDAKNFFAVNPLLEEIFLFVAQELSENRKKIGVDVLLSPKVALIWRPNGRKFFDGSGLQAGTILRELRNQNWLAVNPATPGNSNLFEINGFGKCLVLEDAPGEQFKILVNYFKLKSKSETKENLNKTVELKPKRPEKKSEIKSDKHDKFDEKIKNTSKAKTDENDKNKEIKTVKIHDNINQKIQNDVQPSDTHFNTHDNNDKDWIEVLREKIKKKGYVTLEEAKKIYAQQTGNVFSTKESKLCLREFSTTFKDGSAILFPKKTKK